MLVGKVGGPLQVLNGLQPTLAEPVTIEPPSHYYDTPTWRLSSGPEPI